MATATQWPSATAKFTANFNGSVSAAAGFMGSDVASTVDLGSGRVLWIFGDTFWATAAGQSRAQCAFLRNSVAIQTGYDLSSATMTFYAGVAPDGVGTNVGSFFPEAYPSHYYWANTGILLDDTLLVTTGKIQGGGNTTGLDFVVDGWAAFLISNPSAAPSAWVKTQLQVPTWNDGPYYTVHLTDPGDGYVYVFGRGPDYNMYGQRWTRANAKVGQLMDPEYWYGPTLGWRKQTNLGRTKIRQTPIITQAAFLGANDGSFHRQSDGTWVHIQTPSFGQTHLAYCTSSSINGPFSNLADFYIPPEATHTTAGQATYNIYAGKGHPEQTWSGKAADDILCTYVPAAGPGTDVYTDMTTYYPRVVQVADLVP